MRFRLSGKIFPWKKISAVGRFLFLQDQKFQGRSVRCSALAPVFQPQPAARLPKIMESAPAKLCKPATRAKSCRRCAVSNAVARADILRCPEVVADQAEGQKDVEADLWVRVSAV